MRWTLLILVAIWSVLTAVGYLVVLPESSRDRELIAAYFALAGVEGVHEEAAGVVSGFESWLEGEGLEEPAGGLRGVLLLPEAEQGPYFDAFRRYWVAEVSEEPLSATPTLVWSTDANPARVVQSQLFRTWHLRTYGTPLDIATDPSNRDITKIVVQCVAGAGPDVIEVYGPADLRRLVQAGVAYDITAKARSRGFGVETVFPSALSSISVDGRQYAYPCNIGYAVLLYHEDMFEDAGLPAPPKEWDFGELVSYANAVLESDAVRSPPNFGFMNLGPWDAALGAGARFYSPDGTVSIYNSPETVAGLQAIQDLVYEHQVMPDPGEAASMAAAGGSSFGAAQAGVNASSLFAQKSIAMYIGGRWEYVSFASRNRDLVIRPAAERRLEELAEEGSPAAEEEAELLRAGLRSIVRDVLVPIPPEQYAAIERALKPADRERLLRIGVAHVPTVRGEPYYSVAARVAIANRASPLREEAARFLEFLSSEAYNEQINATFDSICGVPEFCLDEDGISGPPAPLPGLEAFDSPVFVEAAFEYTDPWELSPFIGHSRQGVIAGTVLERLRAGRISGAEAAAEIERGLNVQIFENLRMDPVLRAEWEERTGMEFDAGLGSLEAHFGREPGERATARERGGGASASVPAGGTGAGS